MSLAAPLVGSFVTLVSLYSGRSMVCEVLKVSPSGKKVTVSRPDFQSGMDVFWYSADKGVYTNECSNGGQMFKSPAPVLETKEEPEGDIILESAIESPKYTVVTFNKGARGYFEHNSLGEDAAGGLWFEGKELIDYDGMTYLPKEVILTLRKAGFIVDADFE